MKVSHVLIFVLCKCSEVAFAFVLPQSLEVRTVSLASQASSDNDQESESDSTCSSSISRSRRNMLFSLPLCTAAAAFGRPQPAQAKLVQFPCTEGLMNTYHFMRAGESLLEEQNMWGTNPLFLTNREAALSSKGINQVHQACQVMEEAGLDLSVVKFPIAANAMDTSDIVAAELQIGRNRLVPEYTYLDQRGIGKWDMLSLDSTEDAVWAMDAREAGKEGWVRKECMGCCYWMEPFVLFPLAHLFSLFYILSRVEFLLPMTMALPTSHLETKSLAFDN
jgi:hypothetical protein